MFAIGIVLIIIAIVKVSGWQPDNNYPLIALEQFIQLNDSANSLILWGVIILALETFLNALFDFCEVKSRSKWYIDNKFDYKTVVSKRKSILSKELSSIKLSEEEEVCSKEFNYNDTINTSFLTDCPSGFKLIITKLIVDFIILIPIAIFIVRFSSELIPTVLNNKMSVTEQIEFSMLNTNLIVSASLVVVFLIFNFVVGVILNSKKEKWLESI